MRYLLFISQLIFFLLLTYSCHAQKVNNINNTANCSEWVTYKIQKDENISNIKISPINLGEFSMKVKFDTCFSNNDSLIVKGVVISPILSYGENIKGEQGVQIYICNISNQQKFTDFILLTESDKNGRFFIKFKRNNLFGILFFKTNQSGLLISNSLLNVK